MTSTEIAAFWGSDRTLSIHHPMLLHEFGNTAFVIRDKDKVIAYLFGFFSQTGKTGYVHLIGVRQDYQGQGLGKQLYDHFTQLAKQQGCSKLKAITTPGNHHSIFFHRKIGMNPVGEKNEQGIEVVKNYSGPGQDRVVFEKQL
ncbi:GNAT family N-acetyltransferase [Sediminibacterium soli]|uniref:GNAT family N-acetyltransferase n=1 Tax=Sediminibacterium soli TaxID=2698829 RepID=UPI00137A8C88|nr:GNAT family N-acetyltransferase [Sediminibacterium soli]NCI46551.1 GNAT family N-acetyltransferase [Sediminibacterium soli]